MFLKNYWSDSAFGRVRIKKIETGASGSEGIRTHDS